MSHLITSEDAVSRSEWETVANNLCDSAKEIEKLWAVAFERHIADRDAHRVALAAAKVEKAAPGSPADIASARAFWRFTRTIMKNALQAADEEEAKYQDGIRNRLAAVTAAEADLSRAPEEGLAT